MFVLQSSLNPTPIKYKRRLMKESNQETPAYLRISSEGTSHALLDHTAKNFNVLKAYE
jgi:hypothetical protein